MMSVLTKLLLLATCLSMGADGSPNKKNDETFQTLGHLRPRDVSQNPAKNIHPSLTASGSSIPPLSSSFATGSGWFPISSGTASTGVVPYSIEGAPYQNSTYPYTTQGNGEGENGQSDSGSRCPPHQIVTLPPQTITLPAQTITVTPASETITVTAQAQTETETVTMTRQTQTMTVTVWMTVTAGRAPRCPSPSNAASPQISPAMAPNQQPSITPVVSISDKASTSAIVPLILPTPNLEASISTGVAVPIAKATSSVIPNLAQTTTTGSTFSVNAQTSSVAQQTSSSVVSSLMTSTLIIAPYPYRNTTNQTLPIGSGSSHGFRLTGSGFGAATSRHISSFFVSKFVTETTISTTVIGPSATREYFPGNGSSFLTLPSLANATVFPASVGPTAPPSPTIEYFPDDGSSLLTPPTLANATASPTKEYFLGDGSSLLAPPAQKNATSVPPMGEPKAPITTPAVVGLSQTLAVVVGSYTPAPPPPSPIIRSNTFTSISLLSTPIPPPSPTIVQSNTSIPLPLSISSSQNPQPPTTSDPLCTNGTTTQNITTNVG